MLNASPPKKDPVWENEIAEWSWGRTIPRLMDLRVPEIVQLLEYHSRKYRANQADDTDHIDVSNHQGSYQARMFSYVCEVLTYRRNEMDSHSCLVAVWALTGRQIKHKPLSKALARLIEFLTTLQFLESSLRC